MSIDLDTLSPRELDSLISQAKLRKSTLKKRKPIAEVRAQLSSVANGQGYSIEELFGGSATSTRVAKAPAKAAKTDKAAKTAKSAKTAKTSVRKGRKLGKVAPKYRNTSNADETWSGRGKTPRWMSALVAKGKKPEDFLIKK